ncbi:hypothetical protein QF031_000780 [Pseudarthrobacter defluvii]|uniref:hypothetical protein n=1 Tax=Pseudarthrobacter defluvii TaxID=410837 RepID=UPI002789385D|nr:hypothetical protein [Pseudarthrobacter defluvii]MDQ0768031.1 hypothetical protein [Pseudarthrobacter defluvii]
MTFPVTPASNSYFPRHALQPRGKHPWCPDCDTDFHLIVDSQAVLNFRSSTIAVAVHCSKCRRSKVLETTAEHVAALPSQTFRPCDIPRSTPHMKTNNCTSTAPASVHGPAAAHDRVAAVEHLDLTPAGLADAPAQQQDPDSLVHTGNS